MNLLKSKNFGQKFIVLLFIVLNGTLINAQDAQWRGPNRDGIFPGTDLMKEWPAEGPKVLFTVEGLGKTYSSTVATKKMIYVTGKIDTMEYLTALNHKGKILWQSPFGRSWNKSYPNTRCTPTVENDRLYVLSGMDVMSCFNAKSGELIWKVDIHKTYNSHWDMFGVSESILIVDDMIITTPAGETTTVIALDKMTGELIWKSKSIKAVRSNMSPILIEHSGKKYVITATQTHLLGVDIENGEILWEYLYNILVNGNNSTILANTPIYKDSCLWISNGWDAKSVMLKIAADGKSVSEKFTDITFDNQNHGMVLHNGYVYGSNFTSRQSGKWICMNWDTGEIVWIGDFHNKGPILFADGMLYCYDEKGGNIAMVKADPKKFEVISSFKVKAGKGPHWSRPAIYYGMLLVRHGDVLISYKIGDN